MNNLPIKTGCSPRAVALLMAWNRRLIELNRREFKTGRPRTPEEEKELEELLAAYFDEVERAFRREERKQKRLARGGVWVE